MRSAGIALVWMYILVAPLASHAANTESQFRCLAASRWCLFDDFDPMTRVTTMRAIVGSNDPLDGGTNTSRPAILLACQHGKPEWRFTASRAFSYGPFGIRYRLDPGGVVGDTLASPEAGGRVFRIRGDFPAAAMVSATKMTLEAKLASGAVRHLRFDVSGTAETLKSLGCEAASYH